MTFNQISSAPPIEHNEYFLDDGDTLLLIENILFCVHAYFLRRESRTLATFIDDPQEECHQDFAGTELDSAISMRKLSDSHLKQILGSRWIHSYIKRGYTVQGCTSTTFSNLLWMFYNTTFDYSPSSKGMSRESAVHRWRSILSLAFIFNMSKIRQIASDALTTLFNSQLFDEASMLQTARVYKMGEEWGWKAWVRLCTREEGVGREDAAKLTMGELIKLATFRERLIYARPLDDESAWLRAQQLEWEKPKFPLVRQSSLFEPRSGGSDISELKTSQPSSPEDKVVNKPQFYTSPALVARLNKIRAGKK